MNPQPAWRRREFLRAVGGAGCLGALARGARAAIVTPTPIRRPAGYFALQPGDPAVLQPGNTRIVADRLLQLPQVAGLTIRARWSWIHPSEGKVELGFLEGQADRCRRLAKSYKLLVMTGAECSPSWLGGAWHARAPVPWSAELRAHYGTLVEQLGRRFSDDPLCVGVHMTGPTHPSAEMHPAPGIETVPGYSSDAMIEAWKSSIDAYAAAFPHTAACLSVSVKGPARAYVAGVVAYARHALGQRFAAQHNALKATTQNRAMHQRLIAEMAHAGVHTGYEMVCAAANNPRRFGAADVMAGIAIGKAAGGLYWDVYPPDLKNLR